MSQSDCREECYYLLELAARIEKDIPAFSDEIRHWRQEVLEVLDLPELDNLVVEKRLRDLSLHLRTKWVRFAQRNTDDYLRSPPHLLNTGLASGQVFGFPYDRWCQPDHLEKRCSQLRQCPKGWQADHVLFNSGMAGISAIIQSLRVLLPDYFPDKITLHAFAGLFEFGRLFRILKSPAFEAGMFKGEGRFLQSVAHGESDVVLVEPVANRHDLASLDWNAFVAAWRVRPKDKPGILILDSSMVVQNFSVKKLLEFMGPIKPRLVIDFRSAQKMDQAGLELSSGGIVSVFSPQDGEAHIIANRLRLVRMTFGGNLFFDQIAVLDVPWFLDKDTLKRHCEAVYAHNAYVAKKLKVSGGIIAKIVHPVLKELPPGAIKVSPILKCYLMPCSRLDKDLLRRVLNFEAQRRNLRFLSGSSFGFRGHRFEMGIGESDDAPSFRIAMGARRGPSIDGVIRLVNELAQIKTFAELRQRYPEQARDQVLANLSTILRDRREEAALSHLEDDEIDPKSSQEIDSHKQ